MASAISSVIFLQLLNLSLVSAFRVRHDISHIHSDANESLNTQTDDHPSKTIDDINATVPTHGYTGVFRIDHLRGYAWRNHWGGYGAEVSGELYPGSLPMGGDYGYLDVGPDTDDYGRPIKGSGPKIGGLGEFKDMMVEVDMGHNTITMTSFVGRTGFYHVGDEHWMSNNAIEDHKSIPDTVYDVFRGYYEKGVFHWLPFGGGGRWWVHFTIRDTMVSEGGKTLSKTHSNPRYYLVFEDNEDAANFQKYLLAAGAQPHRNAGRLG